MHCITGSGSSIRGWFFQHGVLWPGQVLERGSASGTGRQEGIPSQVLGAWEGGGCDPEDSGEWLLNVAKLKVCVASHCLERPPAAARSCGENERTPGSREGSQVLRRSRHI